MARVNHNGGKGRGGRKGGGRNGGGGRGGGRGGGNGNGKGKGKKTERPWDAVDRVHKNIQKRDDIGKIIDTAYAEGVANHSYGTLLFQSYQQQLRAEQTRQRQISQDDSINLLSVEAAQKFAVDYLHQRGLAGYDGQALPQFSLAVQSAIIKAITSGQKNGQSNPNHRPPADILATIRRSPPVDDATQDVRALFYEPENEGRAILRLSRYLATTSVAERKMILGAVQQQYRAGGGESNSYDIPPKAPVNNQIVPLHMQGFGAARAVQNDYTFGNYAATHGGTNGGIVFGASQNMYGSGAGQQQQQAPQNWNHAPQLQVQPQAQPQWQEPRVQPTDQMEIEEHEEERQLRRRLRALRKTRERDSEDVVMIDGDEHPNRNRARKPVLLQDVMQRLDDLRQQQQNDMMTYAAYLERRLDQTIRDIRRSVQVDNASRAISRGQIISEDAWVPVSRGVDGLFRMEPVDGKTFVQERLVNAMGRTILGSGFNDLTNDRPLQPAELSRMGREVVQRLAGTPPGEALFFPRAPARGEYALYVLYSWLPVFYHLLFRSEREQVHRALVELINQDVHLQRQECSTFNPNGSAGLLDVVNHLRTLGPQHQLEFLQQLQKQVMGDRRRPMLNRARYLNLASVERVFQPDSLKALRLRTANPREDTDAWTLVQEVRARNAMSELDMSQETAATVSTLINYFAKARCLRRYAQRDLVQRQQQPQSRSQAHSETTAQMQSGSSPPSDSQSQPPQDAKVGTHPTIDHTKGASVQGWQHKDAKTDVGNEMQNAILNSLQDSNLGPEMQNAILNCLGNAVKNAVESAAKSTTQTAAQQPTEPMCGIQMHDPPPQPPQQQAPSAGNLWSSVRGWFDSVMPECPPANGAPSGVYASPPSTEGSDSGRQQNGHNYDAGDIHVDPEEEIL